MNELFKPYVILNKQGRWAANTHDVKLLFGLPENQMWPPEGMPLRVIQGISCWVYPLNKKLGFKLRAYCTCKLCGKSVAIGRLRQHVRMHERNPAIVKRLEREAK